MAAVPQRGMKTSAVGGRLGTRERTEAVVLLEPQGPFGKSAWTS